MYYMRLLFFVAFSLRQILDSWIEYLPAGEGDILNLICRYPRRI